MPTPTLQGLQHTVLGLGDSNYTQFCRVPRAFRTQLGALGSAEARDGCWSGLGSGTGSMVVCVLNGLCRHGNPTRCLIF